MRQGQEPPASTASSSPSPQASSQLAPEHDSEQLPVQVMRQTASPAHVTLLLGPTVIVHSEPPEQSTLQDSPHEPLHSLSRAQSRLQLPPSQSEPSVLHEAPASHVHDVPLHVGGGGPSSPHASIETRIVMSASRIAYPLGTRVAAGVPPGSRENPWRDPRRTRQR